MFIVFALGVVFGSFIRAIVGTLGVDLIHRIRTRRHDKMLRIDGRLPSGRVIHLDTWRRR